MDPSRSSDERPFPSLKELQDAGVSRVIYTPASQRLYWRFDGIFPTAISVMKNAKGAQDDLEPFFNPDTGTWHEISQLPLTEPKISSLEVSVFDLEGERWERDWAEWHEYHHGATWESVASAEDHTTHHGQGGDGPAPIRGQQERVKYGDLNDDVRRKWDLQKKEDGTWTEDSGEEILIRCCGEDRPLQYKQDPKLVVTAGSSEEDFVTVRDFVSAIHPWLMGLRDDIFKARIVSRERPYYGGPPEEAAWMVGLHVSLHCSRPLEIEEKREWVRDHTRFTPDPSSHPSHSKMIEKIRADIAEKRKLRNDGVLLPFKRTEGSRSSPQPSG
ncbi:hypothetical protein QBC32DRAFT_103023 [Pseudoneurospora amorphoporcata]|uniref:Uncharacterized protein n=1 Tax=Pseudoneurospora amorphoporcata TaxID=241081 RepID=A0AAN6NJN1_9PEZI|nr:hypothetical protein QBC32DRAFT_103023 [Pseudoneurospora amorphoporcata]